MINQYTLDVLNIFFNGWLLFIADISILSKINFDFWILTQNIVFIKHKILMVYAIKQDISK